MLIRRLTHGLPHWLIHWVIACALITSASRLLAATWVVAPGTALPSVAQALMRASDGDVIDVQPGQYRGDVAVIAHKRLTIRGIGSRPVILAAGRHAEGKAIWVVRDGDIRIENIEFRGARVPDRNGAGIRFEKGRLQLIGCAFFDNEMGVLTANFGDAELSIEGSQFGQAPTHAGDLHHLLYVGRIARVSVRSSHFSQGYKGHLIKSRARQTEVIDSTIADGPLGQASYQIDLPNGGMARLQGNTIAKGPRFENATLVAFGAEGAAWPDSALTLQDNRLSNEGSASAHFVRVWPERLPKATPVVLRGNRWIGRGDLQAGPAATLDGNQWLPRP